MPALITHYLFGEEALNRGIIPGLDTADPSAQSERIAFYLGCQGPDPFFFGVTTARGPAVRALGAALHRKRMGRAFEHLRRNADRLPAAERSRGEAFVCGLLAHYALDRNAHPYVYALEYELCDEAELLDAHHEVHALIESEIDCGMLDLYRSRTTTEFPPVSVLEHDERAELAAGTLMASVGAGVYGLAIRPTDYAGALNDMRLCYRLIEPYESSRAQRLGSLERGVRKHSQLMALAHRSDIGADNASMNPQRRAWTDPFKGGSSTERFADVFERALTDYGQLLARYRASDGGDSITGRLDYSGRLLGPDEEDLPETPGRPL